MSSSPSDVRAAQPVTDLQAGVPEPALPPLWRDWHALLFVLMPIVVFSWACPNWHYTEIGKLDDWIYTGTFRNFARFVGDWFGGTYYVSRLSWNVPGAICYTLFTPLVANWVLHTGVYVACTVAFYGAARLIVGRYAGLIAGLLFGLHIEIVIALGEDYVHGPCIMYYVVGLLGTLTAARGRHLTLGALLAGASAAGMVYANLFSVVFLPSFVLLFFGLNSVGGWRCVGRAVIFILLGVLAAAAVSGVLAGVSWWVGGAIKFYTPSINFARSQLGNANPWRASGVAWVPKAPWLIVPAVGAIVALAQVVKTTITRRWRDDRFALVLALNHLYLAGFMTVGYLRGQAYLNFYYYTSLLLPSAFLVFAGTVLWWPALRPRLGYFLAIMVGAVLIYGLIAPGLTLRPWVLQQHGEKGLVALLGVAVGGAILMSLAALWRRPRALLVPLALIGFFGVRTTLPCEWNATGSADFMRIDSLQRCVQMLTGPVRPRFWFNREARLGDYYDSAASLYLWGYSTIGMEFPTFSDENIRRAAVTSGDLIFVMTEERDVQPLIQRAFAERGYAVERRALVRIQAFDDDPLGWWVNVVEVEPLTAALEFDYEHAADGNIELIRLIPTEDKGTPGALPLEHWRLASSHATLDHADGHVTSGPGKYDYAVRYPTMVAEAAGTYLFRLDYKRLDGFIQFGVISEETGNWLAQSPHAVKRRTGLLREARVKLEAGQRVWALIANNNVADGQPAMIEMRRFEVRRLVSTEDTTAATERSDGPPE